MGCMFCIGHVAFAHEVSLHPGDVAELPLPGPLVHRAHDPDAVFWCELGQFGYRRPGPVLGPHMRHMADLETVLHPQRQ